LTVFDTPGRSNTEETIALALKAAKERNIGTIIVPSSSGKTAEYMGTIDTMGIHVIIVTLVNGFKANGVQPFSPVLRKELTEKGMDVLTTTHVLSGAERGISTRFQGAYPVEIIAHTLRMFGQGTKVALECAVMALDSGLITFGQKVMALGGTGGGVDTAIVMTPGHASRIFESRLHEVICKPML